MEMIDVEHWALSIEHWALSIEHWALSIEHRASSIEHRASSIEHWALSIEHWTLNIEHWASSIEHCIRYGTNCSLGYSSVDFWRKLCLHQIDKTLTTMWTVSLSSLRRGLGIQSTFLVRRSWTSSSATASGSSSGSVNVSLKRLIQPFVLKCHPDMARQQGLPETARTVNLAAIQNLNSYMDGVHKMMKNNSNSSSSTGPYPFPSESHTVEIEFVISMDKQPADTKSLGDSASTTTTNSMSTNHNKNNNRHVVSSSRRKFELLVPPVNTTPVKLKHHVTRQLLRLLRISDLPAPANLSLLDDDDEEYGNGYDNDAQDPGASGNDGSKQQQRQRQRQRRKMTPWEESRERFWKRHARTFDHNKFNQVYREALHDAELHLMTRNWVRDNPRLRNQLLAKSKLFCVAFCFVWFIPWT